MNFVEHNYVNENYYIRKLFDPTLQSKATKSQDTISPTLSSCQPVYGSQPSGNLIKLFFPSSNALEQCKLEF